MDMQLNKECLRRERELRAWSQSHLAEVAGLSMRTVQRIESTGSSSFDSAQAIAAAFDLQVENLLAMEPAEPKSGSPAKRVALLAALFSSALLAFGWWSHAYADQIMLNLVISAGDEKISSVEMLGESGKASETTIDNLLRLLVTASEVDGNILIETEVYLFNGKAFELKAKPSVLVAKNTAASVYLRDVDGKNFHFLFNLH